MAVTVSGLYVPTFLDIFDTTQLAIDLDLETHKLAMFTNSITPNFSTDTAYGVAPYNANELAATGGYTTGGFVITTTTVTESPAGTIMWDAADWTQSSTTWTNARAGLAYADALAGNNAICLVNFGADFSTVAGTFTVQWASGGIFNWDVTP
jgi:hypothetical protein